MQVYYTSRCREKECALSPERYCRKSKKVNIIEIHSDSAGWVSVILTQARLGRDVREGWWWLQADRTAEALLAVLLQCIKINAVSTQSWVDALTCYYFLMYALAQGWPWDWEILRTGLFALHLTLPLFEGALLWKQGQRGAFADTSSFIWGVIYCDV